MFVRGLPSAVSGQACERTALEHGFYYQKYLLLPLFLALCFLKIFGYMERDMELMSTFKEKFYYNVIQESGYMHIQCIKPDKAKPRLCSCGPGCLYPREVLLLDQYRLPGPGRRGLVRKFSLDELLTSIMLYWTSSITTSQRYYKENKGRGSWPKVGADECLSMCLLALLLSPLSCSIPYKDQVSKAHFLLLNGP